MIRAGAAALSALGRRCAAGPNRTAITQRKLHMTPREADHLQLAQAGFLAQRRLARGLRLNQPEAVALIASQLMERCLPMQASTGAI